MTSGANFGPFWLYALSWQFLSVTVEAELCGPHFLGPPVICPPAGLALRGKLAPSSFDVAELGLREESERI